MYRFIHFTRDKKRLCFLRIKKKTSQVFAQVIIFSRSRLRSSAAVSGFSTIINKLVSSAKRRILDPISVTMSLIKKSRKEEAQG